MEQCEKCGNTEVKILEAKNPYVFFECLKCGHPWSLFSPDAELPIQYEPLLMASRETGEQLD